MSDRCLVPNISTQYQAPNVTSELVGGAARPLIAHELAHLATPATYSQP